MPTRGRSRTRAASKPPRSSKRNQIQKAQSYNTRLRVMGNLFPQRMLVNMRYCEVLFRAVALAVVDEYQFNLNSAFDPNLTGGGHQPMGRDTFLGTIYNKYKVHSARVKTSISPTVTRESIIYMGASNDTAAANGTLSYPGEQPSFQTRLVPYSNGAVNNTHVMQKTFAIWELLGRTKAEYLADDLNGSVYNTSPVEAAVCKVGIMSTNATDVVVWSLYVELDMLVELYDAFTLTQS